MNKLFRSFAHRLLLIVAGILMGTAVIAQVNENNTYDMMRDNGKIYVVVAVCLTILLGLFIYVFILDRKITRLEKGKD